MGKATNAVGGIAAKTYRSIVPRSLRRLVWRVRRRLGKPILKYCETHLVDHCNLNCKGCGHFSPLADPWYADPKDHERSVRQLAQFYQNVERLRLMGGEPLLHPRVTSFFASTRRWLPKTNIRLVTNGVLLKKMGFDFWRACRKHKIGIDVTIYPPTENRMDDIADLVKGNGLDMVVTKTRYFYSHRNPKGDSDPAKAMAACRKVNYCPYLLKGRLYICALPALARYFNSAFGTRIPDTGYVSLYSPDVTGREILRFLNQPADVCRFCSYDMPKYEWSVSKKSIEEWDAGCVRDQ
jgi:hypothetical protein